MDENEMSRRESLVWVLVGIFLALVLIAATAAAIRFGVCDPICFAW
jgi:hypothetical protein